MAPDRPLLFVAPGHQPQGEPRGVVPDRQRVTVAPAGGGELPPEVHLPEPVGGVVLEPDGRRVGGGPRRVEPAGAAADGGDGPSGRSGDARPASTQRRLERTLNNPGLDPDSVWPQLARDLSAGRGGGPIVLILDETPNRNDLRCLKLTVARRKRALPLLGACYALGGPPEPMPGLIRRLFHRAADCLPDASEVTLLADRGLAWPRVVDACRTLGWHFVVRLQGQTRVRTADGRECAAAELALRPGQRWWGAAEVFKKSGWRAAQVAACWEPGRDGPWPLVSDRPDGPRLFRRYARRVWTEELFRDEKSHGFRWGESQVTDPAHAARLVLLTALATILALGLGSRVLKAGLRRYLESARRRSLSLFQIGLRWLRFAFIRSRDLVSG